MGKARPIKQCGTEAPLGGLLFNCMFHTPEECQIVVSPSGRYQGEAYFIKSLSQGHYRCCDAVLRSWKTEIFNDHRNVVVELLKNNCKTLVESLNFLDKHGYNFNSEIEAIRDLNTEIPLDDEILKWFQERDYTVVPPRFLSTKSSRSIPRS